uniref:Ras-GEF domain-containing protein n=1 Tax=Angiostrongylus cantonensis TaxID=6313 RepID=A0A0K0CY80_ANGCA
MCSKMIFDNPDPEDLSFDFSLENTGCVITVRNYRDFNDDSAKKLFPRSSADYVPSATYFSESFWNTERERLRRVLNVWVSNKSKLIAAVPSEKTDDLKFVDCMARVVAVIDMYEWMLDACWDGELKDANSLGIQYLHDFFCDEKHIGKHEGDLEISDVRSAPQWEVALMEHIDEVLIALDKIANAGEYVEEAFEIAVEIRKLSSLVMKRTSSPSTSSAPGLLSPDSGRPSSNESSGNTTTAVTEKQLSCDAQHKDSAAGLKQCGVTQAVQSPTSESLLLPPSSSLATASSSVQTIVPSTSFSTPTTTLSIPKVSPPPLNIDEQCFDILRDSLPAAIEVGCTELGNIMRLCNPVDPTSQIATLAAAMGLNPAPFTTMIQVVFVCLLLLFLF